MKVPTHYYGPDGTRSESCQYDMKHTRLMFATEFTITVLDAHDVFVAAGIVFSLLLKQRRGFRA